MAKSKKEFTFLTIALFAVLWLMHNSKLQQNKRIPLKTGTLL